MKKRKNSIASSSENLETRQERWKQKPVLRMIYEDYYQSIARWCHEGAVWQSVIYNRPLTAYSGHWIIYNNNLLDSVVMFSTSQLL